MKNKLIGLLLLLSLQGNVGFAQISGVIYEWEEKKNKNGIAIYTSSVAGSPFKAVRGVMEVTASVSSLVALVEDLPACPKWAAFCKKANLEERLSDTESYAYIYNDIPFPVSDRDVYTHVVWSIDASSNKVSMTSRAVQGGPKKTKAVRLTDAVSQWHFTPSDNGKVLVENFAHIDPNGPTPAWITNMMLIDSPFDSMSEMRKIVESGEYDNTVVPFLREVKADNTQIDAGNLGDKVESNVIEGESLDSLQASYAEVVSKIKALDLNLNCSQPQDCGSVGIGQKACGGPIDYIVFANNSDEKSITELKDLAQQTSQLGQEINTKSGMMSNCMFTPPPTLTCEANVCKMNMAPSF